MQLQAAEDRTLFIHKVVVVCDICGIVIRYLFDWSDVSQSLMNWLPLCNLSVQAALGPSS